MREVGGHSTGGGDMASRERWHGDSEYKLLIGEEWKPLRAKGRRQWWIAVKKQEGKEK